ncbi:MAG: AarF/ABC1/UbiB kinase family protein [Alphaproteobacteria bacterium]|nr:AarF/ABC1/UbiB kinase family protein [Alphaproteobacteria bacterium]
MAESGEQATLRGRVGRYARVGRAAGAVAARLAGNRYLGMDLDRQSHAADLKAALGGLKGPLMKAAQILATIPDALPPEYAAELAELQANAPSMGWPFVKRRMAGELGPNWQDRFERFDRQAARAASLGQVHQAVAAGGKEEGALLACKLQYPDMASVVDADLNQLRIILSIYGRAEKTVDTRNIHQELAARLTEELDYEREADHTRLYGEILADEPGVQVPPVISDLSTRRLLTTRWLDGVPIVDYVEGEGADHNRVALNMFRAWYVPFYGYGVIHGDPHLGNYTVNRADASVNLYDFGCIRVFKPSFVAGVIDLYHALATKDRDLAAHAYETWGFTDISAEQIDVLNIWAEFIYAPLMEDKTRKIQESDSGLYGAGVANKVHRELKRVGGVTPPREFVMMDRAAIGLGSVFLRLKAEINWYTLFHELIGDFDETALAERQKAMLGKHKVPLAE